MQDQPKSSFPITFPSRQRPTMNPWPEETDVTLEWNLFAGQVNAGATEMNIRWYTNYALSPDIVTPANRSNGFTQWAAMYRFSRVIEYESRITFTNKEVFPLAVLVRHTNIDPGTGTGQFAFAGESFTDSFFVGSLTAGPNVVVRKYRHKIADIVGANIEFDDTYKAANTGTPPANLTFLGLSSRSADGGTVLSAAGVAYGIRIRMKVRFSERELSNDTFQNTKNFQTYSGNGDHFSSAIRQ